MNKIRHIFPKPSPPLETYYGNIWPDTIQREYEDPYRPGLIFVIPPEHVILCPFEMERLRKKYDEEHEKGI